MKDLYTYPQETWDEKKCEKVARRLAKDGYGTPYPERGYFSFSGSAYPQPGLGAVRYNGGTIIDGEHYESVEIPLPKIAKGFSFERVLSWGIRLVKDEKGKGAP